MDYRLILAITAPIVASIITYFVARRRSSGNISTSEASDLWLESQNMRKELRKEVIELRIIIDDLRKKIDELQTKDIFSKNKISELQFKIDTLENRIKELEARI